MIFIQDLNTALLDLLYELKNSEVKIIIGGGFGIYLKVVYVREKGARTLLYEWPEPRSTNDLDLFLGSELLINSKKVELLANAIKTLGYQVIASARNYQFVKPGPPGSPEASIKIDLLTGPQACFEGTCVKTDARRVKPNPPVGIHAHPLDEAPTLEQYLLSIKLKGRLSSGAVWEDHVFIPHPYTFLMMKLFAFKDRIDDPQKEYGRYHALDLYTIMATTLENEWNRALELRDAYIDAPYVAEAGEIVHNLFSALNGLGIIRLRESVYFRPEFQLQEFMSALSELFPVKLGR